MAIAKKTVERESVYCLRCKNAIFMQWFQNPIIAQCNIHNERFVANAHRICGDFLPSNNPNPDIQHFDSYETEHASPCS